MEDLLEQKRYFLKDYIRLETDFSNTDQNRGIAPPPVEKPLAAGSKKIMLPTLQELTNISQCSLISAITNRKSHRKYKPEPIDKQELAFLLWSTQGVRKNLKNVVLRTVPSAGNRHSFETYLYINNVKDLEEGIYRYLPVEHALAFEFTETSLREKISIAAMGQFFVGTAPVVFIWTTIPYRMEWRYSIAAHKVIAIDAGHVCQNLYLACEAIGAGTCAIAAYNQEMMDKFIRVDGKDEFVIYLASVGKV
ncbi:MAG: SagB/ThcOx family dehydrogenase [Actinobacteria bacterium]|nr:SagB/ThcOx family dehydrogenase [Actinomycetota bacterium]